MDPTLPEASFSMFLNISLYKIAKPTAAQREILRLAAKRLVRPSSQFQPAYQKRAVPGRLHGYHLDQPVVVVDVARIGEVSSRREQPRATEEPDTRGSKSERVVALKTVSL